MIWGALYGHQQFIILLLSDATNYARLLSSIRTVMETNMMLYQDFPEVMHPIHKLERTATRALYQMCCGNPTFIKWGTKRIMLPHTEWTEERGNSSICLGGGGLSSSAIRGQVMTLPNGEQVRPTLALVDDPQTRKIAKSTTQCQELEDVIKGDICGMSGPGQDLSLMMACTVISQGDLADRILDKQRNPQVTSIRVATLKCWPDNMAKWEEYAEVRRREQMEEVEPGSATKFYKDNQESLDKGCNHYWPERVSEGFATAIEASMAEYFEDPKSFMSERQNAPAEDIDSEFIPLNSLELSRRSGETKCRVVPFDTEKVTAFVDVQQRLLYYAVVAWNEYYGGTVIDYGTFPKVRRKHFQYTSHKSPTLQTAYKADDDEALRMGIIDLLTQLGNETYVTYGRDKTFFSIERGMIDAGYKTEVVEASLVHSGLHSRWLPAHGIGIGAKDTPIKAFKGSQGIHWTLKKPQGRFLRQCLVDTNYWKSQLYDSLRVSASHPMALKWFKGLPSDHQMIADHCTAEYAVRVEAKGRKIDEWQLKSGKPDNHLFDCLVGNTVAASLLGLRRKGQVQTKRKVRKRELKL